MDERYKRNRAKQTPTDHLLLFPSTNDNREHPPQFSVFRRTVESEEPLAGKLQQCSNSKRHASSPRGTSQPQARRDEQAHARRLQSDEDAEDPPPLGRLFPSNVHQESSPRIDLPAMPLLSSSKKPQKVVILGGGGEYRSSCLSLSANYRRGRSDGSSLEAPSPSPPYCRILAPCSLMIDSLSRRKSSHWSHGCSRSRPQGLCCYRRRS